MTTKLIDTNIIVPNETKKVFAKIINDTANLTDIKVMAAYLNAIIEYEKNHIDK